MKKQLFTVAIFAKLNTRRFFRDRLALFFGILFPVIFLFVFGGIFGGNRGGSFDVAVINQSKSEYATQLTNQIKDSKVYKVDADSQLADAETKLSRGQLDGIIVLPESFGQNNRGVVEVKYAPNNQSAGTTLESILQAQLAPVNARINPAPTPFTVKTEPSNKQSLSQFDYTFSGLLGFAIVGLGIFGPVNVFPELKKQGILRRLHTTPLKVWQYFLSTMISQAIIGLVSLGIMFALAISVFHLKIVGNIAEIIMFLIFSIILILGIGLAIGGRAKNERQAAPLANIVTFPMLFLSGSFFPRFLWPSWLQNISDFIPLTPVIDGIRLLTTEGVHLAGLLPQLGIMAAWMVVVYAIAFKLFRWE